MQRLDAVRQENKIQKQDRMYGKLHPPGVFVHPGALSRTLVLDVGRPTTLESRFRGNRMYLLPLFAANRRETVGVHIRITFFDLASSFNLQSLSLCTPPASSGVIILSMLVSNLKYRVMYWTPKLVNRKDVPGRRSCLDRTACLPCIRGPSRNG